MKHYSLWMRIKSIFVSSAQPSRSNGLVLGDKAGCSTISYIKIGKNDIKHDFLFGTTRYGKGQHPQKGHKPLQIIELESDSKRGEK